MATSGIREGASAMTDESNEQTLVARPLGWLAGIRHFLHEVRLEMKKVSWPSRTEVINTTIIVVIAVFFFAFYLFLADMFFTYFIQWIEAGVKWITG